MRLRLLEFLICPACKGTLDIIVFDENGDEISEGLLHCSQKHIFPIAGEIPRMLPNSLYEYWHEIREKAPNPLPESMADVIEQMRSNTEFARFDRRTKANFSNEWENHDIDGKTWTMELGERVEWFFLDPIRIDMEDLKGMLLLDVGCGNGSQSVAYTEFGLEVIAMDLSTGLEKGNAFRKVHPNAAPEKVHFVQADLQNPPIAAGSFDIIHSAGVLHHTPDTEYSFRALVPLLKAGGTFYVWLYKFESLVTPVVNSMRLITTRLPSAVFVRVAEFGSLPFISFCWAVNKLGLRRYEPIGRREAALALHDIFGAPYAHYHSYEEVTDWYGSTGFSETWPCNDDRRGFGVCGRLPATA